VCSTVSLARYGPIVTLVSGSHFERMVFSRARASDLSGEGRRHPEHIGLHHSMAHPCAHTPTMAGSRPISHPHAMLALADLRSRGESAMPSLSAIFLMRASSLRMRWERPQQSHKQAIYAAPASRQTGL